MSSSRQGSLYQGLGERKLRVQPATAENPDINLLIAAQSESSSFTMIAALELELGTQLIMAVAGPGTTH